MTKSRVAESLNAHALKTLHKYGGLEFKSDWVGVFCIYCNRHLFSMLAHGDPIQFLGASILGNDYETSLKAGKDGGEW